MRRVLMLGGTIEARQLAGALAPRTDVVVTLSLAGRTARPAAQPVPVRTGGFGGDDGLAGYLRDERIDLLIDATHPYAARISANAVRAAQRAGVRLLALRRPPWRPVAGDRWVAVADTEEAVRALEPVPRRVFLALGRKEIGAFARAPQHRYLIRSVDPVETKLAVPHASYLVDRGPFSEDEERALLAAHNIDFVVAKNSGGTASYGKIAAARALGVAVVLLDRPPLPAVEAVETVDAAIRWLDHMFASNGDLGV